MRIRTPRRLGACLVLAMLAVFSCSDLPKPDGAAATVDLPETVDEPLVGGRPGGTFRMMSREPFAIDPARARDATDFQITSYLFTGLVRLSPTLVVSPGVAARWDASPDCSRWTFRLRKGTRFHNGEEVTSASFRLGWERAADSPLAHLLEPVRAVDAADPTELTVTLARPDCEFPQRVAHPVFSPVPSTAGRSGDPAYEAAPVGNGPFRMAGPWLPGQSIRMVRFEDYAIGAPANLDAVEMIISADPRTDSYPAFRAGAVDWATPVITREDVRSSNLPPGKLLSKRGYGTTFLVVGAQTKPLDRADARRAISLAIDRNAIAREAFHNGRLTATSLAPPPFSTMFQGVCDYCRFDPEEARRFAAKAGLTRGTVLHFGYNEQGDQARWTAMVKRQLETTLGLQVNYYGMRQQELAANWAAYGASGIFGADHLSPGDALGPLLSRSSTPYSNPRVDELLKLARSTRNDAQRTELYRLAQQIAVGEDLALIPLWYRQEYRLANTDVFTNLRMDWHANADLSVISLR